MKRRYLYRPDGEGGVDVVEVTLDYQRHEERVPVVTDRYMEGVRATDGTDIGSRAKRRAYMQAHNLADADDFKGTWAKQGQQRALVASGDADTQARRAAIARAMNDRSRPR